MKKIIILLTTISFLTISCKKENSQTNSNITYKQLNLSTNSNLNNIPITGEIGDLIDIEVRRNSSGKRYFLIYPDYNQEISGDDNIGLKVFAKDAIINSTTTPWYHSGPLAGFSNALFPDPTSVIGPGTGDKYIGIRIKLSDNTTHFGWISLNYSSDSTIVTVKDVAYNKIANEQIKAGQK